MNSENSGKTIFMTTHLLDMVSIISDKIIMINKGKIIFNDFTSNLKSKNSTNSLKEVFFELIGDKNDCNNN